MKKQKLAPIVLFVYNRPTHTRRTINALKKNTLAKESKLYVFSDGPKNRKSEKKVNEVRNYVRKIKGFKQVDVIEREENYGLAQSIYKRATHVINKHGKIIFLEDNLIISPFFLKYMNDALALYEDAKRVAAIFGLFFNLRKFF